MNFLKAKKNVESEDLNSPRMQKPVPEPSSPGTESDEDKSSHRFNWFCPERIVFAIDLCDEINGTEFSQKANIFKSSSKKND